MLLRSRQGLVFAAGLLIGIATGAGLLLGLQHADPASRLLASAIAQPAPASATATPHAASCRFDPLLPADAAKQDGRFRMQADVTQASASDVPAYLSVANDAAAQGRVRDAELAYIVSCRMAGQVAGADSPELGDAKYQLASLYLKAAAVPARDLPFEEVRQRAETLFGESVDVYGMKLGIEHEKTRLAVAGLSSIRQAVEPGHAPHSVPRELLLARAAEYQAIAGLLPAKKARPKPVEEAPAARDEAVAVVPQKQDDGARVAEPQAPDEPKRERPAVERAPRPEAERVAREAPERPARAEAERPVPRNEQPVRAPRQPVQASAPPPAQATGSAMAGPDSGGP